MRRCFYLVGDSSCIALAAYVAFLLRFDWNRPGGYNLLLYIPSILLMKLLVFRFFNLHNISWTHTGPHELVTIAKANIAGSVLVFLVIHVLNPARFFAGFPRSIFVADFVLCVFLIAGFRLLKRFYLPYPGVIRVRKADPRCRGRRCRSVAYQGHAPPEKEHMGALGFVDDDPGKQGVVYVGLECWGRQTTFPNGGKAEDRIYPCRHPLCAGQGDPAYYAGGAENACKGYPCCSGVQRIRRRRYRLRRKVQLGYSGP